MDLWRRAKEARDRRSRREAEREAIALLLRRALPLIAPSSQFAEDLGRELERQARLRHRKESLSTRKVARPLLVGAAAISLLGAAFYLWQSRWMHRPLALVPRKP